MAVYYQQSPDGHWIKCTNDQCVEISESDLPPKVKTSAAGRVGWMVSLSVDPPDRSHGGQWIMWDEAGEPQSVAIGESDLPQQIKAAFRKLGKQG